jgi:dCTP deaminase
MSALSDKSIRARCEGQDKPMIEPFEGKSVRVNDAGQKIASYGLSSGGYDISADNKFLLIKPVKETLWDRLRYLFTGKRKSVEPIDFKNLDHDLFQPVTSGKVVVPPGGFLLALSEQHMNMPRDVLALCIGKSTLARTGWNCLCTPLEPGWSGYITLEFQNTTDRPNVFYAHEGCLQLVFLQLDDACETSYADRSGKYQSQEKRIVLPRV